MANSLHILMWIAFLLPPLFVFGLVLHVGPKLGNIRRVFFFAAACVAGVSIVGLAYVARQFLGLQDVRLQAIISLVLLILVGIDYNRRYPQKRY